MSFQNNVYYNISAFGPEAMVASEALLKSYPLTKICLEILGKKLPAQLELGFFESGNQIIKQGETGKDLFLLCNHVADVIVFDRVIVKMEAPALFGDKALIDKSATRNATISIAEGDISLIIKIPVGKFIRESKQEEILDAEFKQETQIYYNLFLEIQNRLFKYAEIQKNLWTEVSSQLKMLNIQLITNIFNKQEERNWDAKAWQIIIKYLLSVHKFPWPKNIPFSIKTFVDILRTIQDRTFPRKSYKGSDQNYAYHKQMIWKKWLGKVSELVIQVLPNDQLPIGIGEVELFNPRIYQIRMHGLLTAIEKKFMFKKVPPKEGFFQPDRLKAKIYFGKDVHENEFNLDAYLKALKEMFNIKNPNRVLAQVAQQTAQLSATCENEFNASVSKMQHFLEKVRKLSIADSFAESDRQKKSNDIDIKIATIKEGLKAYNKRVLGMSHSFGGVIRFSETKIPIITDVIKSCGTDLLKKNVEKAFRSTLKSFGLKIEGFSDQLLAEQYYICQGDPSDVVPTSQLMTHYWIPISGCVMLKKGNQEFVILRPGTLIGGGTWEAGYGTVEEETKEREETWTLRIVKPEKDTGPDKTSLILIFPRKKLPWCFNSDPLPDDLYNKYIPIIQLLIEKYLENIMQFSQLRDALSKKYSNIIQVVIIEKKVREFESNQNMLSEKQYEKILDLVFNILGSNLEKREVMSSEKLSKQIYNHILKQTKRDFPNLNIEEQGNKAYTLWRFVQSEIITHVFADEARNKAKVEPPQPALEMVKENMEILLRKNFGEAYNLGYKLSDKGAYISLKEILNIKPGMLANESLALALSILDILESCSHNIVEEGSSFQERLKQVSSIETEFDVNEIQSKFILESIAKLRNIIQVKMAKKA